VQVQPGQARPYTFGILNNGSAADSFDLNASAPGFSVALSPASLVLRPGEVGNVTITMTPQPGASAGVYRVDVGIRGARSGVESRASVNAAVGAVPRLALALADPGFADRPVFQGDEVAIVVEVRNGGNARQELVYDVTQEPNVGPAWEAQLSRISDRVDAAGVSTNTLTIRVPVEALNGTANAITITARGDGVQASTKARLVVNPQFTVSLSVIPQSKVVAPGKSGVYNLVVANNGTLRESYQLVFCNLGSPPRVAIPCLGNSTIGLGGWSVALDTSPFTLDHDQSRSFQMAIAAPHGAIPGVDKLTLQVEAISATPYLAYPSHQFRDFKLVLTSVGEPEAVRTPPSVTPGFEVALLGLGAVAAAAVLRRR
jgi:hypothetical protein